MTTGSQVTDPRPPGEVDRVAGRRVRGRIALSVAIILLVGATGAVGSWAAWVVSDSNPTNTFSTTTVLLQDNQGGQGGSATSSGTAMFNVTNLQPGSSATTACIGVVFSGSASSLTLGATLGGADQATLAPELTMDVATLNTSGTVSVTGGTNTNSGSCAGYPGGGSNVTVGSQGASLQAWAAGGPYSITGPVTDTWYWFTVSGLPVGDTNCAVYCGRTITMTLTWTLTT